MGSGEPLLQYWLSAQSGTLRAPAGPADWGGRALEKIFSGEGRLVGQWKSSDDFIS